MNPQKGTTLGPLGSSKAVVTVIRAMIVLPAQGCVDKPLNSKLVDPMHRTSIASHTRPE